jgi:hypothetical protein
MGRYALHARATENVDYWSAGAHAFKVHGGGALNQLARAPVVSRVADALVKMFMVGASSDGCNFTAALPRSDEVAAAVRNAIELLGSWEPVQQVAPPRLHAVLRLHFPSLCACRTRGPCSAKHQACSPPPSAPVCFVT